MSNILSIKLHNNKNLARILEIIKTIEDPRRTFLHPFESILIMLICAIIAGANNAIAIELFCKNHKEWFKKIISLPYGIPSHDTFNRMLGAVRPDQMESLLLIAQKEPLLIADTASPENTDYSNDIIAALKKQICFDAKVLRALKTLNPLSILGAFIPSKKITVAEEKVIRTNEITVIPKLLQKLKNVIKGLIISIDAIGAQVKIAALIIQLNAHYLLALKGNQHQLYADVKLFLDDIIDGKLSEIKYTYHETLDKGHGRIEKRQIWTTDNINWLYQRRRWKGLKTLSVIQTTIEMIRRGKVIKKTITRRYYISSLLVHAQVILALARNHWAIENQKHWPLNVAFREHIATIHKGWGAENMAILRRLALALHQNNSTNLSINNKRDLAACNEEFMLTVFFGEKVDLRNFFQKCSDFLLPFYDRFTIDFFYFTRTIFAS